MEGITLCNSSSHWNMRSVDAITILVVDDDITCLSIVAAILKKFRYEVVTVKHPNDALCTLRIKEFDLVVSDVHMPDMNGFELQQAIAQEFDLPVVLMSADDEEGVALKGLERGAAFFIMKPVCPDDFRDLWQFASMKKTGSQVVIEETDSSPEKNNSGESEGDQTVNKAGSTSKRKSPQKEGSDDKVGDNSQSASTKKPKVIWTISLHNRFLEAIRSIGLDRAVPKKILEVMNVPGLTRENVASHLQKYRIFLRRVSDASFKIQYSADKGPSRNLRSGCESSSRITSPSSSSALITTLTNLNKLNQNQFGTELQPHSFTNLETQSGFGQSRLLSNRGWSWPKPNTGIHQNRLVQNDYHTPPCGPLANISLEDVLSTNFDSFPAAATENAPCQNNSDIMSLGNFKTNYVGYSLSSIHNLTRYLEDRIQMPNDINYVEDGLLGDIINNSDYGMLMMSSSNQQPAVVGEDDQLQFSSCLTPIFDLSELDIMPNAHDLGGGGFLPHDQLSIHPHDQQKNGGETSANSIFYGDLMSHWDNPVLSFDQSNSNQPQSSQGLMSSQGFDNPSYLNETVVPPIDKPQVYGELSSSPTFGTSSQLSKTVVPVTERDDDEFLEYLLAPFGEDQTPEGLI